jgi:hypothetical protein
LTACNNSGGDKTSEKELELQKRELDLKQKELELKEKELSQQQGKPNTTLTTTKTTTPSTSTTKTTSDNSASTTGYNYAGHGSFQTFWADFKKAITTNDRDAVAEMTYIPFHDKYQETYFNAYGGDKPWTANSKSDFLSKYDKIIIPATITAVKGNKYRTYQYEEMIGGDVIEKGEYLLNVSNEGQKPRSYDLAFAKKNGVFKLVYMPYYE